MLVFRANEHQNRAFLSIHKDGDCSADFLKDLFFGAGRQDTAFVDSSAHLAERIMSPAIAVVPECQGALMMNFHITGFKCGDCENRVATFGQCELIERLKSSSTIVALHPWCSKERVASSRASVADRNRT